MKRITERAERAENTATTEPAMEMFTRSTRSTRSIRPWLSGLGAVAAVALLLGMAAMLFGGRFGVGLGSRGGPAQPSFVGTQGIIADVSMVSPTEGWAMAQITKAPGDSKSTTNTVTFYHLQNGSWTPVTVLLSNAAADALKAGGAGGFNGAISMDSATDGWAIARNFNRTSVLFHYTDGKWQEAQQGAPSGSLAGIQATSAHSVWTFNDPFSGGSPAIFHFDGTSWTQQTINAGVNDHSLILTLQMASDDQGWALMKPSQDFADPNYTILTYAGNNNWTTHSTFNAGNLGEISGFAMISTDEGWAFGPRPITGKGNVTAGKPVPQALYHYSNGKWQTAPVNLDGGSFVTLQKIVMRSSSDGWIIAQDQNQRPGITASGIEKCTILLHYDGKAWTQVRAPDAGGDASAITGMSFAGDSGWASGYVAALPDGKTIQDSDVPSYGSPMLWVYQNGGWTLYQQK
jgi:hypothetical protein